jgi:hypothetical protein
LIFAPDAAASRRAAVAGSESTIHCVVDMMYADTPYTAPKRAMHRHPMVAEFIPANLGDFTPRPESASRQKRGRKGPRMSRHLRFLSKRASSLCPAALRRLDFGEVVAVLIIAIGVIPFASAGLWASP